MGYRDKRQTEFHVSWFYVWSRLIDGNCDIMFARPWDRQTFTQVADEKRVYHELLEYSSITYHANVSVDPMTVYFFYKLFRLFK